MVTIGCIAYTAVCALLWALCSGWLALVCLLMAALCLVYYRRMAYKHFGGVTGDLGGWFVQITELALTAVVIMGGKLG